MARPGKKAFTENELIASICRSSLYEFVKEMWPVVSSETPHWNWHIEYLCGEIQKMAERIFKSLPREYDLIVNVAPGTTKSTVLSVMFPAWAWTRMPSFKFIGASYAYALAMELSRKCRDVVKSDKYQACFPEIKIRDEQDSKGYFINTFNGSRYAVGVNGSVTGMHASLIGVDDPLDPEQSFSEAEIAIANRWMIHTLPSRKVDKAITPMILIQQRLRSNDCTGDMLENAKRPGAFPIKHVKLPADDSFDIQPPELAARYVDGLMDPVRLPWSVLKAERARNEYSYTSQYGQDPRPAGSRMFEEEYFNQRCRAAPYDCQRIRFWDRAATSASDNPAACYTAGVLMAKDKEGNYYVEHMVRGQWEPTTRNNKMRACALRDRSKYGRHEPVIWVEREGGSSGRDAWKGVARDLAGFVVREATVTGKKEVRAEPWSCQAAAKNVWMVEDGTWDLRGFIEEHLQFPFGKLKDIIDSASGAFNLLSDVRKIQPMKIFTMKHRPKTSAKIVVCLEEDLHDYHDETYCLIVRVRDLLDVTGGESKALIQLSENVLGDYELVAADLDPADYQDKWDVLVPPYDKLPADLIFTKEDAKKLWAFVMRPREPYPSRVVFAGRGSIRAAESVARGVLAGLHLDEDSLSITGDATIATSGFNRHLCSVTKSARNMVVG